MSKLHEITSLTEEESSAIRQVISKIRKKVDVKKILLFGSKARGDFNRDSDIDLLVLADVEVSTEKRWEISDIATEVAIDCDIYVSCKLLNYYDWQSGDENKIFIPFKNNVVRDGVEIDY
jgi:uncharacterized protein